VTEHLTNDTAGAGSPAPAVSSVSPDAAGADVVAPEARVELDRIRRRWAELPIDRAESRMPVLRSLVENLAPRSFPLIADHPPRTAAERPGEVGDPQSVVPDLGPAVVVDQVAVLVWDAYAAGRGDGIPQLLTGARRELG